MQLLLICNIFISKPSLCLLKKQAQAVFFPHKIERNSANLKCVMAITSTTLFFLTNYCVRHTGLHKIHC